MIRCDNPLQFCGSLYHVLSTFRFPFCMELSWFLCVCIWHNKVLRKIVEQVARGRLVSVFVVVVGCVGLVVWAIQCWWLWFFFFVGGGGAAVQLLCSHETTAQCCDNSFSVSVAQLVVSVLIITLTSHAGLESYQSRTHLSSQPAQHTCDTCLTLHGGGSELRTLSCSAASWNLAWNRVLWSLVNIQSNDDARGKPLGRGERTERNGPATSL